MGVPVNHMGATLYRLSVIQVWVEGNWTYVRFLLLRRTGFAPVMSIYPV